MANISKNHDVYGNSIKERIGRLQQEYRAGHRSAEEYWTAVSYAVHQFNW